MVGARVSSDLNYDIISLVMVSLSTQFSLSILALAFPLLCNPFSSSIPRLLCKSVNFELKSIAHTLNSSYFTHTTCTHTCAHTLAHTHKHTLKLRALQLGEIQDHLLHLWPHPMFQFSHCNLYSSKMNTMNTVYQVQSWNSEEGFKLLLQPLLWQILYVCKQCPSLHIYMLIAVNQF